MTLKGDRMEESACTEERAESLEATAPALELTAKAAAAPGIDQP